MQNVRYSVEGDELVIRVDLGQRYGASQNGRSEVIARSGGFIPLHDGIGFSVFVGRSRVKGWSRIPTISEAELAEIIERPRTLTGAVAKVAAELEIGRNAARRLVGLALGNLLAPGLEAVESREGQHVRVCKDGRSVLIIPH